MPPFERNTETLGVLLALASRNEPVDEDRRLLARAKAEALSQTLGSDAPTLDPSSSCLAALVRESVLSAVEAGLPPEGKAALDAMTAMAVQNGHSYPQLAAIGHELVKIHSDVTEAEDMSARIEILAGAIRTDTNRTIGLIGELQADHCTVSPGLPKSNLDLHRKVKAMSSQLIELQDRVATLTETALGGNKNPFCSISDVVRAESGYLAVLAQKRELDAQLASFAGLPSDVDMARSELDALRRELLGATSHRDAMFEGLVERESPVKKRR